MKKFDDFFRNNLKVQDQLKKVTEPLKRNFGIDDFWHLILNDKGSLANISTYYDQWGCFWENECYQNTDFMIAPSSLNDGCFLLEFDHNFLKVVNSFSDTYSQHHPFIMIRKESKDKAHIFGFCARRHTPSLPSFYMNNLSLLNSFIEYHLSLNEKFIKNSEENIINIAALRGHEHFYKRSYGQESLSNPAYTCNFFENIGVYPTLFKGANKLSFREKQVLVACLDGKTAAEHGEELGLSPRTIQSYIVNTKNKLGILTREELIENAKILKMAGFLN